MSQYLRVVRKGKHNSRVELPDHSTTIVPNDQLPLWELVQMLSNQSTVETTSTPTPTTDTPIPMARDYLRVVRKGKHNVRVELPDHTTTLVSVADLPNWHNISESVQTAEITEEINEIFDTPVVDTPSTSETIVDSTTTTEVVDSVTSFDDEATTVPITDLTETPKPKKGRAKGTKAPKATTFRRQVNNLGTDHPYECVDTEYETVVYEDGIEAPF